MLDDLKMIHERDHQDALGTASKQHKQLDHKFELQNTQLKPQGFSNIIIAGMGGSALAASVLHSWPTLKIPLEIVRGYNIPDYAGKETLFIASSYSGNTEETLEALKSAQTRGCAIAVISSGGKLAETAKDKNYPLMVLPGRFQPRMAVFYSLSALVQLLVIAGVLSDENIKELSLGGSWLESQSEKFASTVPASKNPAKKLAQELVGSSIVVYSGPLLYPAAYKWKINFNENAKNIAWCGQYPEINHNDILGWTSQPVDKPYKIVELRSSLEHPRVQKRFEATEKLLSGKRPSPHVIAPEGETLLHQLLYSIQLGDFTSIYLALLNGLNPSPVDLIEKLKKELSTN